jgi:hypothetical protein
MKEELVKIFDALAANRIPEYAVAYGPHFANYFKTL